MINGFIPGRTEMLIDEFLPEFDFDETHNLAIRASAESVYRVLNEVDFSESWLIRWLFRLRGLPAESVTLKEMRKLRFETLGETVNQEILLGLAGRFWTPNGDLKKIDARNFRGFNEAGYAKAVWNFSLDETDGDTNLTTETRIKCLDTASRRSFGFYWTFIRPFSGLIRKEMLRTIKRKAEAV